MPRPRRPLTPHDERHGTPAGHRAHLREGSKPCARCLAARNAYRREWRQVRRLLGEEAS